MCECVCVCVPGPEDTSVSLCACVACACFVCVLVDGRCACGWLGVSACLWARAQTWASTRNCCIIESDMKERREATTVFGSLSDLLCAFSVKYRYARS